MDVEKIINEEMMRVDDEEIKAMAHTLWIMYSSFIKEGFTKQQAMDIIKTALKPK